MRVLLIEDDARIASFVRSGLEGEAHAVVHAGDAPTGLARAFEPGFDVIILDLMLPGGSGESVLAEARRRGVATPVLVLTAKDGIPDKVAVLDLGADDYLTKPFSFSELSARMRALLRRRHEAAPDIIQIDDLVIDPRRRTARRGGVRIELTTREFDLLFYLAENAGSVLTRRIIAENVWGAHFDSFSNVIDVNMNRLRQKVDQPFGKRLLHTIRGIGYVLRVE